MVSSYEIGSKIERIRKAMGLSRTRLGLKARINPAQIYRYETGRSKLYVDRLQQIAEALQVKAYMLLKEE